METDQAYSVRGHSCGDGFKVALVGYLRHKAEVLRASREDGVPGLGASNRRNAAALTELAEAIAARSLQDHRLVALWNAHAARGGDRLCYAP